MARDTLYDQERPDHTGRFKADDTARKWIMRYFAFWGFVLHVAVILFAVGVYKLAT